MNQNILLNESKTQRAHCVKVIQFTGVYFLGVLSVIALCGWASTQAVPNTALKLILCWSGLVSFVFLNSIAAYCKPHKKNKASHFGMTLLLGMVFGCISFMFVLIAYISVCVWGQTSILVLN